MTMLLGILGMHLLKNRLMATLLVGCCFAQTATVAQTNTATAPSSADTFFQPNALNPTVLDSPYNISLFWPENGEDGARAWSQTKSIFAYGLVAFGVLVALPEESTGWQKSDNIFDKWVENVKDSPEWDRNDFIYNYVGHAYFGGVYYQVARKSGYRQWDSFIYTFLMSTFYWEYGVEAFAETPSVQDIVYTPFAGWIYGEWAYQTEKGIRERDNKVLGSGLLGGLCLILLDPVDAAGRGVNAIFGRRLIKAGYGYFSYFPAETPDGETDHQVYLHVRIPIGAAGPDDATKITTIEHADDPVDTGILALSGGVGYAAMDDSWGLEDGPYTKIGLGLHFTPRISTRLDYAWGDLKQSGTGETQEYENYSIDTQLYLNPNGILRPYVSGGLGRQTFFRDNNTANFQWNGGLGIHCRLHRKLALNADWINYYSPSSHTYDQQFNAGLIYRFGRGEHYDW